MNRAIFLGSGGARVMLSTQILSTGGIWLHLEGTDIYLDPGPGALVRSIQHNLNPASLKAILLSHRHLDHCGDANAMIEAMTQGGSKRQGLVLAPPDALDQDPVVLRYLHHYVEKVVPLTPLDSYTIGHVSLQTSMPHRHGSVTTFGFRFNTQPRTLAYLPDTKYFEELEEFYHAQVLIISMLRLEPSHIEHLSVPDVIRLLNTLQPEKTVLTHFGIQLWKKGPHRVAKEIAQATGLEVLAAYEGLALDF